MGDTAVGTVLVVDDDPALVREVVAVLGPLATEIRTAGSFAEAEEALDAWRPDLLLLDVILPDGDALQLLELLHRVPPVPPTVVMSGQAGLAQAHALGRLGTRAFLAKPFDADALRDTVTRALAAPVDPIPAVRDSVGKVPLATMEERVRSAMVDEALKRAGGNRRAAARLLDVSRQMLQQVLKRAK